MSKSVDLTTLSGYESLPAGTYQLGVKAKASGYTDSNLSSTVSFTKLAAPVATAADTTVTWDAITNAESYDVYVDGELYENTTGGTVTMISFKLWGNGTHQAEEGMTWEQWANSSYNTINLYASADTTPWFSIYEVMNVVGSDVIIADKEYILYDYVGGGIA